MDQLIKIDVSGDQQVGIRFDAFPDDLHDDLKAEIGNLGADLYALVEANTPEQSGRLRSQERLRVFDDKTRITAYVDVAGETGKDFAKAGALEWGAHRAHKVAAHKMKLDHFWEVKLNKPITVLVAAFNRVANLNSFQFERGPLAAMAPEAIARLNAVVEKATAKANA